MLWQHVLNVTACGGGVFCFYLWTLAELTACIIRRSVLQSLGISFFLDDRKTWTVATLFPEVSAFRYQGKYSGFCSLSWSHCNGGVRSAITGFPSELASFRITWQHHLNLLRHPAEHCGSAVPVCLFAPLPLQVKQIISGFICTSLLVVVLAERLLGSVLNYVFFLPSYFSFSCSWPDQVHALLSDWKEVRSMLVPGSQGNCF